MVERSFSRSCIDTIIRTYQFLLQWQIRCRSIRNRTNNRWQNFPNFLAIYRSAYPAILWDFLTLCHYFVYSLPSRYSVTSRISTLVHNPCGEPSVINLLPVLSLHWRHNERDGVSNHWCLDCLLNCLFGIRSRGTPKLRVTRLCEGNSLWLYMDFTYSVINAPGNKVTIAT